MNKNSINNKIKDCVPIARCKEMCPDQEYNMRIKNNLVNILEKKIIK